MKRNNLSIWLASVLAFCLFCEVTHSQQMTTSGPPGPVNTANIQAYQMQAGGSVITMAAGKSILFITTTSLLSLQTVRLPPSPADGQVVRISSAGIVTGLTVQDNGGTAVGTYGLTPLAPGNLFLFTIGIGWVKIA